MKVFVSYSFEDSKLHLLSLLFENLRKEGHKIETSDTFYDDYLNNDDFKIYNSDLFLGIITNNSESISEVVKEWEIAQQNDVKSILLIEKGVKVDDNSIQYIRFDRHNPKIAIDKLFGVAKKKVPAKSKNDDLGDALVGAGIIVGVAALIALLAGGGKK